MTKIATNTARGVTNQSALTIPEAIPEVTRGVNTEVNARANLCAKLRQVHNQFVPRNAITLHDTSSG
jgi:hypothetical protein